MLILIASDQLRVHYCCCFCISFGGLGGGGGNYLGKMSQLLPGLGSFGEKRSHFCSKYFFLG